MGTGDGAWLVSPANLLDGAERYLASRQCRDGGFCYYRSGYLEEPNLFDTWHAVAAFALLGRAVPRGAEVAAWLDGFDLASQPPDALYYLAFSKRLLAAHWAPDQATRARIAALPLAPPARDINLSGWLAGTLRKTRLKAAFAHLGQAPAVVTALRTWHQGGYGLKPNLQDTELALELLAALGEPDPGTETGRFVDALQDPQLGFRNTLDSRYVRLAILLAGVRCCLRLGLPVRFRDAILDLVRAARTGDGAFADVPGAVPTLDSHYRALALLLTCGAQSQPGRCQPVPGVGDSLWMR